MLGVHHLGFAGSISKQRRIEFINLFEDGCGPDIARIAQSRRINPGSQQLFIGKK